MKMTTRLFQKTAQKTIQNNRLKNAYQSGMQHIIEARQQAYALVPDVDALRGELKHIRQATIVQPVAGCSDRVSMLQCCRRHSCRLHNLKKEKYS